MPVFIKRMVWNWKYQSTSMIPPRARMDCWSASVHWSPTPDSLIQGCGPGNLRAALRTRGWNGHFVGVDVSEQVIEVARKSEDTNAEWHVSAIEDFPIPHQKVSTICLCESIYYVDPGSVQL